MTQYVKKLGENFGNMVFRSRDGRETEDLDKAHRYDALEAADTYLAPGMEMWEVARLCVDVDDNTVYVNFMRGKYPDRCAADRSLP